MSDVSRRKFVQAGAAILGAAPTLAAAPARSWAAGSDAIRVGVIGCGGRGTGAAHDAARAGDGVEIVALGDLAADRLERCRTELAERIPGKLKVEGRMFTGFDAYRQVLATDVNLVILAAPPGFRPAHFAAAVAAGKHIFTEKPVAVDPVGVRAFLAAADRSAARNLSVVAGTQRRHDPKYVEAMRRIHGGAIGEITGGQVYWNQGGLWTAERKPGMSDVEWQIRNWLYFTWLSGDHVVEQHIHNIDVANWALRAHPVRANGVGGRQVRTEEKFGHIFDHFAVELEYPNGAVVLSMCRQQDGTSRYVGERFAGTRGSSDGSTWIRGAENWEWPVPAEPVNPYVQEHVDLIAGIRAGRLLNEARQVAESTLSAILVREAAYTGQAITWDEIMASDLDLTPPGSAVFGPLAVAPVAQPGHTQLSRPPLGHRREAAGSSGGR
jgi:predicted dehydrogenase